VPPPPGSARAAAGRRALLLLRATGLAASLASLAARGAPPPPSGALAARRAAEGAATEAAGVVANSARAAAGRRALLLLRAAGLAASLAALAAEGAPPPPSGALSARRAAECAAEKAAGGVSGQAQSSAGVRALLLLRATGLAARLAALADAAAAPPTLGPLAARCAAEGAAEEAAGSVANAAQANAGRRTLLQLRAAGVATFFAALAAEGAPPPPSGALAARRAAEGAADEAAGGVSGQAQGGAGRRLLLQQRAAGIATCLAALADAAAAPPTLGALAARRAAEGAAEEAAGGVSGKAQANAGRVALREMESFWRFVDLYAHGRDIHDIFLQLGGVFQADGRTLLDFTGGCPSFRGVNIRGIHPSFLIKFFARLVFYQSGMSIPPEHGGLLERALALLERRKMMRRGILEERPALPEETLQGLSAGLRSWTREVEALAPPPPALAPFRVPGDPMPTLGDSVSLRVASYRCARTLAEAMAYRVSGTPDEAADDAMNEAAAGFYETNQAHKATRSMLLAAAAALLPSSTVTECLVQTLALWAVVDREEFPRDYELRRLELEYAAAEFEEERRAAQ